MEKRQIGSGDVRGSHGNRGCRNGDGVREHTDEWRVARPLMDRPWWGVEICGERPLATEEKNGKSPPVGAWRAASSTESSLGLEWEAVDTYFFQRIFSRPVSVDSAIKIEKEISPGQLASNRDFRAGKCDLCCLPPHPTCQLTVLCLPRFEEFSRRIEAFHWQTI